MALPELLANSSTPGSVVALTTLGADMTTTNGLTFTMAAAAPAALRATGSGQFRAVIDSEIVIFDATAVSTTTWTALTRGAEGSTAATHSSGASVFHYLTAAALANYKGALIYGDGSDGSVTISTTVTLVRDMVYQDLHITSAGDLNVNSQRVFVAGTLTIDSGGALEADGNAAVHNIAGAITGTGGGTLGRGGAGGGGGGGVGAAGTAASGYRVGVGAGASGGASDTANAGGAGGGTPNPIPDAAAGAAFFRTSPAMFYLYANGYFTVANAYGALTGGTGGGAGGGSATAPAANGAGGGGGAGILLVFARFVVNNGRISANGGAGDIRSDISAGVNGAGGGGGGGGGLALVHSQTFTGNAPTANGGAGGVSVGTGVSGSNGAAGTALSLIWL